MGRELHLHTKESGTVLDRSLYHLFHDTSTITLCHGHILMVLTYRAGHFKSEVIVHSVSMLRSKSKFHAMPTTSWPFRFLIASLLPARIHLCKSNSPSLLAALDLDQSKRTVRIARSVDPTAFQPQE